MLVDVRKKLESVAARLRGADQVTIREVEMCLRAARKQLLTAGVSVEIVDAMAGRVIDTLMDRRALENPGGGDAVAGILMAAFESVAALYKSSVKKICADCGEHHWNMASARRGRFFLPASQPALERRVVLKPGRPFRAGHGLFSCDHHHPALDRNAVRRLLRSLGPEQGPEPPAGGSLSLV